MSGAAEQAQEKDTRSFYPHTATMQKLAVGDRVVFDPFYGIETVTKVSLHTQSEGYESKSGAERGIEDAKRVAKEAEANHA